MRDEILFQVVPVLAVSSCALALLVQAWRVIAASTDGVESPHERSGRASAAWRLSMVIIVLGHLFAFAKPDSVLVWDRQPLRLVVLESAGWLAGIVMLGGSMAIAVRRFRSSANRSGFSPIAVISATVSRLALLSGVAIALSYRWASYWSAVTLTPYVHSLIRGRATLSLVSSMPTLVKLHVLCAFGVLALLPWTAATSEVLERAWRVWRVSPVASLDKTETAAHLSARN